MMEPTEDAPELQSQGTEREVIALMDSWLEEDAKLHSHPESWAELKRALDRDRPSSRLLFPDEKVDEMNRE
jgi:hypothetical protein